MKINVHDRIEAIAGAIALGEASDEERREYREHIAGCASCLDALGGECEIERVASVVSSARDSEVWEPEARDVVAARMRRRSRTIAWAGGALGTVLAGSFLIYMVAGTAPPRTSHHLTPAILAEQGALAVASRWAELPPPPRRLVVTHNVVQIARAPVAAPPTAATQIVTLKGQRKPRELVAITVHPDTAAPPVQHENGPPVQAQNQTAWRTVARTTTTSVTETAPQTFTHSAESLQVAPNYTREVAPVGGDTAINPQPPMIAYDEGAEGTTVFEVIVDERGTPTKCVITKSAGYPVLDDAVCKAAMKARYTPKIVDGRAVTGVYRDAFTFHMSDQTSSNIDGVPQPIPGTVPVMRPRDPSSIGNGGGH